MDAVPLNLLRLKDLGEIGLLQRLRPFCQRVGDDGAILDPISGQVVVTTDVLVDGVHFSDLTTPAFAVGYRAAAANLSDLAAMGSLPVGMVVGLGLPRDTPVAWIEELYQGLNACAEPWGMPIVGGDLCRAAHRFISITALGQVQPGRAIERHRPQVGDYLVVTGSHGSSRAGLALLQDRQGWSQEWDPSQIEHLIKTHQYPQPRLDVLPLLASFDRVAGMDTSDGLADALVQVCGASGVGARVEARQIPMDEGLRLIFPGQSLEWALYGGEDFELLLSLPPAHAHALVAALPGSAVIGEVVAPTGDPGVVEVIDWGQLDRAQGFAHFS
ncbi:MAG: thiamine-phosphate kinase [Cyanophyceae cyanobacterium]